jgi:hypothetical protein
MIEAHGLVKRYGSTVAVNDPGRGQAVTGEPFPRQLRET